MGTPKYVTWNVDPNHYEALVNFLNIYYEGRDWEFSQPRGDLFKTLTTTKPIMDAVDAFLVGRVSATKRHNNKKYRGSRKHDTGTNPI